MPSHAVNRICRHAEDAAPARLQRACAIGRRYAGARKPKAKTRNDARASHLPGAAQAFEVSRAISCQ